MEKLTDEHREFIRHQAEEIVKPYLTMIANEATAAKEKIETLVDMYEFALTHLPSELLPMLAKGAKLAVTEITGEEIRRLPHLVSLAFGHELQKGWRDHILFDLDEQDYTVVALAIVKR